MFFDQMCQSYKKKYPVTRFQNAYRSVHTHSKELLRELLIQDFDILANIGSRC